MGKLNTLCLILLLFLTAACQNSDSINDELNNYNVVQTHSEATHEDFIFRLFTEKEYYNEDEDVLIHGEIEYNGEKDEIIIYHAASAITFPMTEKIRNFPIDSFVQEIGLSTRLKRGIPYRETYQKNVFYDEHSSKEYIQFTEEFSNNKGFPVGYYVVNGYASFAADLGDDDNNRERIQINAMIDFKVK